MGLGIMIKFVVVIVLIFVLIVVGLVFVLFGYLIKDYDLCCVECQVFIMFILFKVKSVEDFCENYGGVVFKDVVLSK